MEDHVEVCHLILDSHTQAGYRTLRPNISGDLSVLVYIGSKYNIELIHLLHHREKCCHKAERPQTSINTPNQKGLIPLLLACKHNLPEAVEGLILSHGVDSHTKDDQRMSLLAVAAFCGCEGTVQKLLSLQ